MQPDAPSEPTVSGPSLAPVTMPAPGILETPTPPPLTTVTDLAQRETGPQSWEGAALRSRAPKWLGLSTVGAGVALLFFAILFAAGRGAANRAAKSTSESVAVPALARPEVAAMASASLRPLELLGPELGELAAPGARHRDSAHVTAGGGPVAGHTAGPTSGNRAAAIPRPTRQVVVQAPPSATQSTIQASIASTGGEVDSVGGKVPLRPIETRDPYGTP